MSFESDGEAQIWFRQAQSNYRFLSVAKKSESYDLVCFLSQQVAEEALRAYLVCQGKNETSTHAVVELCQIASQYDEGFLQLKNEIEALNYFNIVVKHSNPVESAIPGTFFSQADAEKAIVTAKEVLDFVRDRLPFEVKDSTTSD
jgi:HEPN domain-containing protein